MQGLPPRFPGSNVILFIRGSLVIHSTNHRNSPARRYARYAMGFGLMGDFFMTFRLVAERFIALIAIKLLQLLGLKTDET
jgi:hypothetical protein